MSALERVRDALTSRGSKIETQGRDRFVAQCPSHEDGRPSLSVRQGDRGVLLYCFAGCTSKDIAEDLGLRTQDLFDADRIDYRYQDREGRTVRKVSRTPDKDFPQSGTTKWAKGTSPLYRLPEVLQAVQAGKPVYLTEGEKDAETLRLLGVTATTTAAGASQPHFTDFAPLAGAEVRLVPDQDAQGEKYAAKVSALLEAVQAASITVWKVKAGKDFADHYAAGFGLEDLEEVHVPATSQEPSEDREESTRRVVLTPASQVRPKVVHWLWESRLPKGALTLLAGREGLGKSTLCVYLAAQVTRGTLAGQSFGKPASVVWVTSEDDPGYNVVPRLMAAGADLDRVHFLEVRLLSGGTVPPVLPLDLERVEATIREVGAVLMVVDPLVSVLDSRLDSHKDHSVRQALDPISKLARDAEVTVLGITHVGKSRQGDFSDRVLGSRGFTGAARSVLALMKDPDDPEERRLCLGLQKSNYGDRHAVPTLSIEVQSAIVPVGDEAASVGKVVMLGETTRSISDLLADSDDLGERADRDEAEDWLRTYLEERGGEAPAADIRKDCQKDGISYDTLKRRPCERLGVVKAKSGMRGGWLWSLPVAVVDDSAGKGADDDREEEEVLQSLCEVQECESDATTSALLDGKRWRLCDVHATDPALPLILGGQQRIGETA
jgi:hypothetical protein